MGDTTTTDKPSKKTTGVPDIHSAFAKVAGEYLGWKIFPAANSGLAIPNIEHHAREGNPNGLQFWMSAHMAYLDTAFASSRHSSTLASAKAVTENDTRYLNHIKEYDSNADLINPTAQSAAKIAYEAGHHDFARGIMKEYVKPQSQLQILWPLIAKTGDVDEALTTLAAGANIHGEQRHLSLVDLALARNTAIDRTAMVTFAMENGAKIDAGTMSRVTHELDVSYRFKPDRMVSTLKLIDELGSKEGINYFTKKNILDVLGNIVAANNQDQDKTNNMSKAAAYLLDKTPQSKESVKTFWPVFNSPDISKMLFEKNFLNDKEKSSFLSEAVSYRRPELVQMALEQGAKGDATVLKGAKDLLSKNPGPETMDTLKALEKQIVSAHVNVSQSVAPRDPNAPSL